MKNTCIVTGVEFETSDPDCVISPLAMENIVKEITNNKKLKNVVISAMVKDTDCMNALAAAMMNCKAADIGISVPGTIAEFFYRIDKRRAKRNSSKISK